MRSNFFILLCVSVFAFWVADGHADEQDAQRIIVSHGLSTFGELKYPADFEHFDYVNPDAPKGGKIVHSGIAAQRTFDSFNPWILKGDAAEGTSLLSQDGAASLIFDTLMIPAGDEPDSYYGLVAREVEYPEDRSWVIFRLREEARFHDGSPLTAEDVKFSLETIKEDGDPRIALSLQDVDMIEVLGPHEVKVTFAEGAITRDMPMMVASYPVLSKAYYTEHDFTKSSLEKPLGNGPYTIGGYKQGSWVEYNRNPDYWGKDLPVNKGRWNFDTIRYEFYQDRSIGLQAFKAGQMTMNEEFSSKFWATEYDFPAAQEGRVQKRVLPDVNASGVQGFFINTRRDKFKDVRVRKALDLAFDFEWSSKTLFYGLYKRTTSYFEGSVDLAAGGLPTEGEIALLEPYRDQLPAEVFDEAYVPPVSDGSGRIRGNLRKAKMLLSEAGWNVIDGELRNAEGEGLSIEFLITSAAFERVIQPFIQNLNQLGIQGSIRLVDSAQYERRWKSFDYDVTIMRISQSNSPGIELRNRYGSDHADTEGGWNFAGVRDPIIDDLIEVAIAAKTREELTSATKAIDRLLRAGHYWVPNWNKGAYNIAHWDVFEWPETRPLYQRGILDTWWAKESDALSDVNAAGGN